MQVFGSCPGCNNNISAIDMCVKETRLHQGDGQEGRQQTTDAAEAVDDAHAEGPHGRGVHLNNTARQFRWEVLPNQTWPTSDQTMLL